MRISPRLCLIALAGSVALTPAALAQTQAQQQRWETAERRFQSEQQIYERERDIYEAARRGGGWRGDYRNDRNSRDDRYRGNDDRRFDESRFRTEYDASRHYRSGNRYRERTLTANDEVYRGSDGRYYCRRTDGTTGLIVGGAGGAILGNVIDGGRNRAAGTLIGGALGALLGREVERSNDIRCK